MGFKPVLVEKTGRLIFSLSNIRDFNLKLKTLWLHHRQHTHTESHKQIQDMVLSFLFYFHHSFTLMLSSFFCFLSFAAFLFFITLFFIVSHSSSLSFVFSHIGPLLSPPSGSLAYISVIYFYKCQTEFLPSIQREEEMKRKVGKWQQISWLAKVPNSRAADRYRSVD